METFGAWGSSARSAVRQIGSRVVEQTGDCRATQFLLRKISLDVQRGVLRLRYHHRRIGQSLLLCPQNVDEFACDDIVIAALTIFWLC